MSQTTEPAAIPNRVVTRSTIPNWRIAKGVICQGREADGTYETTPQLVGRLMRVGIHTGTTDDGSEYTKVECELETATGKQSVGVNTSSLTSSITFLEGLLACAKNELIAIEANAASKANRYGSFSTYANFYKVDPVTLRPERIRAERTEGDMAERQEEMMSRLLKHPAYSERQKKESDTAYYGNTPSWKVFADEVEQAGVWPPFETGKVEYLAMCAKLSEVKSFDEPSDVPESTWAAMRSGHAQCANEKKVPAALKTAHERWQKALVATGEFDPFA